MRGKPKTQTPVNQRLGITPACAGKTGSVTVNYRIGTDHPRVCGENSFLALVEASSEGSPPRVRGKLARQNHVGGINRITPACAGKTA